MTQITVNNNIPEDAWPSLFEGISIHWHGFSMKGFAWMDGTKYIAQCPIQRGKAFTYKFQVRPAKLWGCQLERCVARRGGAAILKCAPGS